MSSSACLRLSPNLRWNAVAVGDEKQVSDAAVAGHALEPDEADVQ